MSFILIKAAFIFKFKLKKGVFVLINIFVYPPMFPSIVMRQRQRGSVMNTSARQTGTTPMILISACITPTSTRDVSCTDVYLHFLPAVAPVPETEDALG